MPEQYKRIDHEWPKRRQAWEDHYLQKGCSERKAQELARKKRNKTSWP